MKISRSAVRVLSLTLFVGGLAIGFQNCSPTKFTSVKPANDSSNAPNGVSNDPNCQDIINTTQENLRIIFMVDNSDSTGGRGGTDPNKYYRVQVLNNFIAQYGSKTNFNYAFGWFAPSFNIWDISQSKFVSSAVQPVGGATDLSNALAAFQGLGTQSGTAYKAAFTGIQSIIDTASQPKDGWNYVVIFMSDGKPTDLGGDSQQASKIQGLVATLQADVINHGSLLSVSAVYFGPESDTTSINNLQTMAATGGGQFVDTNQVTNLTISDIIQVPGNTCNQ